MPKKMKRFLCCLTPVDVECMRYIMAHHGYGSRANAARFAILRQAERSAAGRAVKHYEPVKLATEEDNHPRGLSGTMDRWHQLYTDDQIAAIGYICERHKLRSKSQAVRFALRVQAAIDGMRVPAEAVGGAIV